MLLQVHLLHGAHERGALAACGYQACVRSAKLDFLIKHQEDATNLLNPAAQLCPCGRVPRGEAGAA
jgi:hypothetical protein